jgi:hypothetical protein
MSLIAFTSNYQDKSTENGYQFEFYCDHCGSGYLSRFQENKLGMASGILRAAGSIFGSALGHNAADGADYMRESMRGKARDEALRIAVEEAKKVFKQCPRCGKWVCPEVSWNANRGMCVKCAPDFTKEVNAAQATGQAEHIWREARMEDGRVMRGVIGGFDIAAPGGVAANATCPSCGAVSSGGKFCNECGKPLNAKVVCSGCGTEAAPGAKFCGNCGNKIG